MSDFERDPLPSIRGRLRSKRVQKLFKEPSKTRAEFLQDTDIKYLLKKFGQDGQPQTLRPPQYGDTTVLPESYFDALMIVRDVNDAFSTLPARIREELANDPANLLRAMESEQGLKALRDMGVKFTGDDELSTLPVPPAKPVEPPDGGSV